ncbi:hypothetical protein Nmel_014393 [Mimus melanotis]
MGGATTAPRPSLYPAPHKPRLTPHPVPLSPAQDGGCDPRPPDRPLRCAQPLPHPLPAAGSACPRAPTASLCPSLAARVFHVSPCRVLPLCCRPSAWDRAARPPPSPLQPPGLLLAPCRSFSNNKIQVDLDESSGVAMMKFKSPPVNSLSLEFLTEFSINLEKLENNRACRGVIITSAVPKIFSSGLDITEMCGKSMEHYTEFWRAVQEMWLRLYGSNMVTVAAVNGSSPAGGCLVALSCDYRIMAENPKFSIGLNEAQLGIVAPFWFKDTFVNVVGHRIAERSLQLGSLHPAPEAHKLGLVDELVPEEKLMEKAAAVMAQWLALPDHARQLTKTMMRKAVLDRLVAHREEDIKNFITFVSKESIQKSLRMYMEMLKKRKS